jgi:Rps23 Pro-64 3,4-dihydroxylase Tpa1-like proline 4-hydroxylase
MDNNFYYGPLFTGNECHQLIAENKRSKKWLKSTTISEDESIDPDRNSVILPFNDLSSWSKNLLNEKKNEVNTLIKSQFPKISGILDTFDLVKYNRGGYYVSHRDTGTGLEFRLLTVIIYLSDKFTGGETILCDLEEKIKPKLGHILIFPSHLLHEGKEVLKGSKFILLTWFNLL